MLCSFSAFFCFFFNTFCGHFWVFEAPVLVVPTPLTIISADLNWFLPMVWAEIIEHGKRIFGSMSSRMSLLVKYERRMTLPNDPTYISIPVLHNATNHAVRNLDPYGFSRYGQGLRHADENGGGGGTGTRRQRSQDFLQRVTHTKNRKLSGFGPLFSWKWGDYPSHSQKWGDASPPSPLWRSPWVWSIFVRSSVQGLRHADKNGGTGTRRQRSQDFLQRVTHTKNRKLSGFGPPFSWKWGDYPPHSQKWGTRPSRPHCGGAPGSV